MSWSTPEFWQCDVCILATGSLMILFSTISILHIHCSGLLQISTFTDDSTLPWKRTPSLSVILVGQYMTIYWPHTPGQSLSSPSVSCHNWSPTRTSYFKEKHQRQSGRNWIILMKMSQRNNIGNDTKSPKEPLYLFSRPVTQIFF